MFFWKVFLNQRKEFVADVGADMLTVGGIKPCYVPFPISLFCWVLAVAIWLVV